MSFINYWIILEPLSPIVKGTAANPNAVAYQLHDDKTNNTISFVKLSNDLLHLLDKDKRLMIGNAAWSYTLSRKQ